MATRAKDGPLAKAPTLSRPSSSKSLTSKNQKQDSTSSEKKIPNYLKSTRSSSGIDFQSVKKKPLPFSSSSTDVSYKAALTRRASLDHRAAPPTQVLKTTRVASSLIPKPILDRRRSFDRPPPPQATKTRVLTQSASSSAIKSKMIGSHKGLGDLLLKSPKAPGGKKSLVRRPVSIQKESSSSNAGKNQENEKLKGPVIESTNGVDNHEIDHIPNDGNLQALVSDEEITIYSLSDNEMLAEIVEEEEDQEHIDPKQLEVDIQEPVDIKIIESSTVQADQDAPSEVMIDETDDHDSIIEEKSDTIVEPEQDLADKSVDSEHESLADKSVDSEHETLAIEPEDQEKVVVENANEASDMKDEIQKEAEEEVKVVAVEEVKKEVQKTLPKRERPVHAKRESAVYNDVIEETASKLREQRKNKVKALAGAFETVISLQDPK